MMAMFGWTDPKMPAHYIAQANREKLGFSGMDKVVSFDQSGELAIASSIFLISNPASIVMIPARDCTMFSSNFPP
jgi:hypothetical protein